MFDTVGEVRAGFSPSSHRAIHSTWGSSRSLHPQPFAPIPDETVRGARAAFPKGNASRRMREERGVFSEDAAFADHSPARGQPGASPWRLALVLGMPFAEGLADRQAVDAVRSRINDGVVHWRANDDLPPASQMISSPYDLDARSWVKGQTAWTGDTTHLTEVCDPDRPYLSTRVETTRATVPDAQLPLIYQASATKDLLPCQHGVDVG